MDKYVLTPDERATLQYRVTSRLREAILRGEFKHGERLVQEEWAKKLGVSRMPIREALKQLEVEGLVRLEPRKGAIVTPISEEDIHEIYSLRALLESEAVVKSLPYLKKQSIRTLDYLVEEMEKTPLDDDGVQRFTKLNTQFHEVLREGCSWRRLHSMIEALWNGIPPYTPTLFSDYIVEDSKKEHRLMVKYVKENNPDELAKVVRKHIMRTCDQLINFLQKQKSKDK